MLHDRLVDQNVELKQIEHDLTLYGPNYFFSTKKSKFVKIILYLVL